MYNSKAPPFDKVQRMTWTHSQPVWRLGGGDTHRNHLLFLALLGQVLDAVDEELVGADVGPAGLDHPAAQLHQLGEDRKNKKAPE